MTAAADDWADAGLLTVPGTATPTSTAGMVNDDGTIVSMWWKFTVDSLQQVTVDYSASEGSQHPAVLSDPTDQNSNLFGVDDGQTLKVFAFPGTYYIKFLDFKATPHTYTVDLTSTPAVVQTIRSRPSNETYDPDTGVLLTVIPPSEYVCGDQNLDTYRDDPEWWDYGLARVVDTGLDPDDVKRQGTEFLPLEAQDQTVLAEQRACVIYSCDYPINFMVGAGDGAALTNFNTESFPAGTKVQATSEPRLGRYGWLEYGSLWIWPVTDPEVVIGPTSIRVYEWWIETDILTLADDTEPIYEPIFLTSGLTGEFKDAGVVYQ